MSLRNRLVADGVYTFAFRIANMACAAVLGILTARLLGPHGRGIYAMPMVDAALVTAAYSGLSSATSYFLLRANAGRGIVAPALLGAGLFVSIGAVFTTIIAIIAHHPWAALPAALSLPGTAALMMVYGYATGVHRVRLNTSLALTNTGVLLVCMITAFIALGAQPGAAIIAWVIAGNIMGVAIVTWMIRDAKTRFTRTDSLAPSVWKYVAYAGRTGAVSLVSLLNYRADVYIVAVFTEPAMLGMYTLAVTAAETLLAATQVTALVASPHIGTLEERAAVDLVARCVRHNLLVATVCCGVLALVAPVVVQLFYGQAFVPMVPALRILLIGVVALSLGSPMSSFFTLRLGKPELPLLFAGISATICIVVSLLLVPRLGLVGAAIGSTVAYIVGQTTAITYFGATSGITASRMLVPRASDLLAYLEIFGRLLHRIRPASS